MNAPLVSVVMPCRNQEKYLATAVESVLSQTFREWELLLWDDGSEDETNAIARRYLGDPRVRLFGSGEPIGAARARNALVREARAAVLSPCDGDDILMPFAFDELYSALATNTEIGLVYGDCLMFWEDDLGASDSAPRWPTVIGKDPDTTWDLREDVVNHGGSLIRRSAFDAAGGYSEDSGVIDDLDLVLRLAEVTRFRYLRGVVTYAWRRHPRSMSVTDEQRLEKTRRALKTAIGRRYPGLDPDAVLRDR